MTKIIFRKTGNKLDELQFINANQIIAEITNPAQGILPHDFIHAIVEKHFQIRGFTDLIFSGEPERGMKTDDRAWLSEAMVESIQGMLWSGKLDQEQFNDWVLSICNQRKVPPFYCSQEQFLSLCQTIETYLKRWKDLDMGGTIEFVWNDRE